MRLLSVQCVASGVAIAILGACSDGAVANPGVAGAAGSSASNGNAGAGGSAAGAPGGASGASTMAGQSGSATGPTGGAAGAQGGSAPGGQSSGGAGGSSGGAGGAGAGGQGGASAGAGGGAADGWVDIFNGKDLTGWVPLIHKWKVNEDPYKTFRADADKKVIRITYDDYPGQSFDDHCGLLYYDKYLTDYRVRVTYRFYEPQAKNPVSWGRNNSGLMLFGIDPTKVTGDPEFPPVIEIQLLGTPSAGGSNNGNLCQPGGMGVTKFFGQTISPGGGCRDSKSGKAPNADQWVTVEADVHATGETNIYQCVRSMPDVPCTPDTTKPILTIGGIVYQNQPVTGGYLSLQSESQPVEFKDVQLKEAK